MISDLLYRLRALIRRRSTESDLDDELCAHFERQVQKHMKSGLPLEEARRRARLEFGGFDQVKEECREARGVGFIETTIQDLRYGLRMLRKSPGFTAVAILTLALGIGANAAIFSLIDAVLLRALPFPHPDRLVAIWERRSASGEANIPVSGHEFVAWSEESHTFDRMALYATDNVTVTGHGEPESIGVLRVSAEFFPVLGIRPALGRTILSGEDRSGRDRVAVLSDGFWHRRFGGDASIVGQSLTLNDDVYTVIGVMPPLPQSLTPDLWVPMDLPSEAQKVGRHSLNVIGRLKPGVTLEQSQTDLDVAARRLEQRLPQQNTGHRVKVLPMREDVAGDMRVALLALLGAVGFVLLIACLNVASLLVARGAGRQTEIAIRQALGASRIRLVRQLITESLLLAGMGGGIGVCLAVWLTVLLPRIRAVNIPLVETVAIDWQVLAAAAVLALLSGVACGLAPALRASRRQVIERMKEGRRLSAEPRRHRLGAILVAAEVALAFVLLVGAGLMMKSFIRLVSVDPGFTTRNVLVASVALAGPRYPKQEQDRRFFAELVEHVKALPGVESVGATTNLPLQAGDNWIPFSIEGRPPLPPGQEPTAAFRVVTTDYFRTLRIPLRRGRFFSEADKRISVPVIRWYDSQPYPANFDAPQPVPVAIVSEAMARQYWPNQNPIGRRFRLLFSPWITVVGVVGDVKHGSLDAPYYPHIYLPYLQEPWSAMTLVVRTTGPPLSHAAAVREEVRRLDPDLPVAITAMDDVLSDSVGRQRFYALLVSVFGALALGLAVVGIFGLASYSVSQRINEIGVRMALGAHPYDIVRLIIGHGSAITLAGMAAGTAGALALTRPIKALLFNVAPSDPMTFVGAIVLLAAVALLATFIPARRATKVDPMVALRHE